MKVEEEERMEYAPCPPKCSVQPISVIFIRRRPSFRGGVEVPWEERSGMNHMEPKNEVTLWEKRERS